MEYTLRNGVSIPKVGYGVFRMENDLVTKDTIIKAIEEGYRHIDTAKVYKNEEVVGQAIKECGVKREDLFITTKLSNQDMRDDRVDDAFNEQLDRLGLSYFDLYLTHWPVPDKYIDAYLKMEKYYEKGLIKSIGVSNYQIHHFESLKEKCSIMPMVNQIEVNPYLANNDVVSYCQHNGVLVEAYSPLCSGKNDVLKEPVLTSISEKHGKSNAQVILRWLLQRDILPIVKTQNVNRLKENISLFDFELDLDDMKKIDSLNTNTRSMSDPDNFNF